MRMLVVHLQHCYRVRASGYPVQQVHKAVPLQQQWSGTVLGSLFSGLSNCSVNISPQNFVVNVNPPPCTLCIRDDLIWFLCVAFLVTYLCCHILSGSITLFRTKPHPGGYEYCPADLAVTVVVLAPLYIV